MKLNSIYKIVVIILTLVVPINAQIAYIRGRLMYLSHH
jgi:hypothetical protein